MTPLLITIAALAAPPSSHVQATMQQHAHSPTVRYLSLEHVPQVDRKKWHDALLFTVASASRAVALDSHVPRRIKDSMTYWIDLARLGWSVEDFNRVLERYPYDANDPKAPLLTIRADWLLYELADPRQSDAYYRLLYGAKHIPKTADEFLAFWGADPKRRSFSHFGWTETASRVNKSGTRFLERYAADDLSVWRTKDAFDIKAGADPLESLDGNFAFNGEELIAQFPKSWGRGGKLIFGKAQAYLLANAQGNRVEEAPVDLVEDSKGTLGQRAIITFASCVVCHERGMQMPSENGLASLLKSGVALHVKDHGRLADIEAFHLRDVAKQLTRDAEDYTEFIKAVNGLEPEQNAANFKVVLDLYRGSLSLELAAAEIGCTVAALKLSLAKAGGGNIDTGSRLSWLAAGRPIAREQWEDDFRKVQALVRGVPIPQYAPVRVARQQAPPLHAPKVAGQAPAAAAVAETAYQSRKPPIWAQPLEGKPSVQRPRLQRSAPGAPILMRQP
jgi:hypothetical protein